MRALKALFVQMPDIGTFDLPPLIGNVYDIRGEAGTFGYQLVSSPPTLHFDDPRLRG